MEKVILSLTTIPQRLNYQNENGGLKPVINRLLNLSYRNYEIHLNIPFFNRKNQSEYILPEWLLLIDNPKLKIFRTEDYGSITKIVPTLMRIDENSEQIIITVDDDLEYMDGFIEYHLEKRKLYPDCAIGFAGITAVDGSCHFCTTVKSDVRVKILEGYKTVSYKRNFFKSDFFKNFVGQSWSDDVIISAYLGKNNIHKMVVNYNNDTQFNPVVESFPVVGHLPNEYGGCYWFRNEQISDNADVYYKLGYLER